ncbi:PMS1 protein homolog 1-like isoform X2 [Prorops nasuta]|uniref:PMS1 protein homolog 1-like isoform X2 n=1 Tax=Prorops nasuta TaxID=863751 RepID=UPI0034CFF3E5
MSISALDGQTAKLLTTTQIITSVYSTVKELIENSLDANAKNIELEHGLSLIEVKDDGVGIPKEEVQLATLASHTSKILNFEDLDKLETYGFRGEALSALCRISEVEITTKTSKDDVAVSYYFDQDGCIIKTEKCHRPIGTTVRIKNIFIKLPVRRQTISTTKKVNENIKLVEVLLQGYGICRPDIRICYRVNNDIIFIKPSLNSIKEAAGSVLGKKIITSMKWICHEEEEFTLTMMIPSKNIGDLSQVCKSNYQFIFINNRPVRYKELEKILLDCLSIYFDQKMPSKKRPIFVILILTDPDGIDVNLEPNKDLVLFKDQKKIFNILTNCLKEYYQIQLPPDSQEDKEKISNESINEYQDSTIIHNSSSMEEQLPACKKRKIDANKCEKVIQVPKIILENGSSEKSNHSNNWSENLTAPKLSDSESEEEIPVVDLGEDFDLEAILNKPRIPNKDILSLSNTENMPEKSLIKTTNQKEQNEIKEENKKNEVERNKNKNEKITLEEWSKGHVAGLKSGADIESYDCVKADSVSSSETAIAEYTRNVISQITKENPSMNPVQIAKKITDMWKGLSSEERGYYRDIAQERKVNNKSIAASQEKKSKNVDVEKNKKKFINMLENMKKSGKASQLAMRSIIPWELNINKVTTAFESDITVPFYHVIGKLNDNQWFVKNNAQLWLLDASSLRKECNNDDVFNSEKAEELFKNYLITNNDLSMLYPICGLRKEKN